MPTKSRKPKKVKIAASNEDDANTGSPDSEEQVEEHVYPLRSRILYERLRKEWEERQAMPRKLDTLPFEIILRIIQYLSVQDLFALRGLNKRLKVIVMKHLSSLKRVNFSSGLPFAYLPSKLDDAALKCILSCTPEVTHILGFYPRRIYDSHSPELTNTTHALTYEGVYEAFRSCSKLRSVELMDVGLMSILVTRLPNVKFHGMFRNRPDSWDSEYAVPMPPEPIRSSTSSTSAPAQNATTSDGSGSSNFAQVATSLVRSEIASSSRLAKWLEPVGEVPQLQGAPCCPQYTYLYPHTNRIFLQPNFQVATPQHNVVVNQEAEPVPNILSPINNSTQTSSPQSLLGVEQWAYGSMIAFAMAAAFVPPESVQPRVDTNAGTRRGSRSNGATQQRRTPPISALLSGVSAVAANTAGGGGVGEVRSGVPVSPIPQLSRTPAVHLPMMISNLTKLDLVSVAISALPRLDNVKYLHLKWVNSKPV